jgi:hypothetical protein
MHFCWSRLGLEARHRQLQRMVEALLDRQVGACAVAVLAAACLAEQRQGPAFFDRLLRHFILPMSVCRYACGASHWRSRRVA